MLADRRKDLARVLPISASLAVRDYIVGGGAHSLPWTVLTRSTVQVLFLWTFSRYVAPGYGESAAFIGAVAFVCVEPTISRMSELIQPDRTQGVLYRLILGRPSIFAIMVSRAWVYTAEGVLSGFFAGVLVGAVLHGVGFVWLTVTSLPFLVLVAMCGSGLGLAIAAASQGRTVTPMVGYFAAAMVLLFSGAIPTTAAGSAISYVGNFLPLRHGLAAARQAMTSQPWLGDVAQELAVGAAWTAVGAIVSWSLTRRSLRDGFDSFE